MDKTEVAASLVILAIGVALLVESYQLPYMAEGVPGSGFLPLWVSLGIIGAGATLILKALRGRPAGAQPIQWPDALGWRQVGVMLLALALALVVLETLGFLITTTLFMAVVVFSLGVRSWRIMLTAPVGAAGILYLVFAIWLRVPLPPGLLGVFD